MNYKLVFPAVIVVFLLGAGIFFTGSLDQKEAEKASYSDLRADARDSSYMVNYEVSFARQISGGIIEYNGVNLYSSEGVQKQVTSWSSGIADGAVHQVSFMEGNDSVVCRKDEDGINVSSCKVSSTDFEFLHNIGKRADKIGLNITEKGSYKVAGRKCKRFSFKTSSNSSPASERLEGPARYDVCLDKKEGYIAAISVTGNLTSLLGGAPVRTTLVNMKVVGVNTDFDKSLKPPFTFEATADCFWTEPKLKVMAYEDISRVKVEISGENHTYELGESYETSVLKLPEEKLVQGSENDLTVYSDGEKDSANCQYQVFQR